MTLPNLIPLHRSPDMPQITCRFVANRSFISRCIRWVTNSLWSHVEFGTPQGTWIGAHVDGGVQERPADYCVPYRESVYDVPVSQKAMDAHLARIRKQIGTRYNTLDIIGLLIRRRKWTTPNAVICSEFFSNEMLALFTASHYLNVAVGFTHLISPETAHLSPILVGHKRTSHENHR